MNIQSLSITQEAVKQDVDTLLKHYICDLPPQPTKLADAMEYALLNGGKRMRPLLCVLVAEAVSVNYPDALVLAAAIECIHAYSLIHDDLPAMDNDDIRRGKPTCHIQYDEATAILAGDALQTLAFDILSRPDSLTCSSDLKLKLVQQLSKAAGYHGMVGGQAIDLAATGENSQIAHTLDTLKLLHKLKTGALLKTCVSLPLLLARKVDAAQREQFMIFAESIGLAFQVQDDILDCVSDTESLGKPVGSDDSQHKHTFPALLGIAGAKQELQALYERALQALNTMPYNTESLAAFCDLMIKRKH